jgi:hypothetical protein
MNNEINKMGEGKKKRKKERKKERKDQASLLGIIKTSVIT